MRLALIRLAPLSRTVKEQAADARAGQQDGRRHQIGRGQQRGRGGIGGDDALKPSRRKFVVTLARALRDVE